MNFQQDCTSAEESEVDGYAVSRIKNFYRRLRSKKDAANLNAMGKSDFPLNYEVLGLSL